MRDMRVSEPRGVSNQTGVSTIRLEFPVSDLFVLTGGFLQVVSRVTGYGTIINFSYHFKIKIQFSIKRNIQFELMIRVE